MTNREYLEEREDARKRIYVSLEMGYCDGCAFSGQDVCNEDCYQGHMEWLDQEYKEISK